jgi:hypothetical protein
LDTYRATTQFKLKFCELCHFEYQYESEKPVELSSFLQARKRCSFFTLLAVATFKWMVLLNLLIAFLGGLGRVFDPDLNIPHDWFKGHLSDVGAYYIAGSFSFS